MPYQRNPIIREWLLPGGALAGLVALLTAPAILTGQIPYFMDTVMQFYPARLAAAAALHRGEFPFWNPTYYCGAPLWANPQWSLGWPGLWLFLAFPKPGVYTFVLAAHLWLGAMGMMAWARAAGMGRWPALAGAAFYLLNGYTWAHWAFGSYFIAMGAGPWTLALMTRLRTELQSFGLTGQTDQKSRLEVLKFIPCFALVWTWLLLSGAPQIVWLFALWFGFTAIWDSVAMALKGYSRASLMYAACLAGAALLAFGLAAPQVLPMLALQGDLTRADALPLERVATGALTFVDLVRALLGGAGFPEDANTTLYFGALGVALVVIGFLRGAKSRGRDVFILLIFLVISLHMFAPMLYHILPGYARFHDPRRALTVVMPLLCIVAAGGVARLSSLPDSRFRMTAIIVLASLTVPALLEIVNHWRQIKTIVPPPLQPVLGWIPAPASPFPLMFLSAFLIVVILYILILVFSPEFKSMPASKGHRLAMALVCLGAVQMFVFAIARVDAKFIRASDFYHESEAARFIRESGARYFAYDPSQQYSYDYTRPGIAAELMPNTGAALGLRDFQGYDPAIPRAYREFLVSHGIGGELFPQHFGLVQNPWAPALAEAGVRWAVGDITAYYPAAPRDGLRERQTLRVPLPELLPRRMNAIAISLAAAKQNGLEYMQWLVAQVDYSKGAPGRHIVVPPQGLTSHDDALPAEVTYHGDYSRAVITIPLDPAREVSAITLAHQLAPGSVFDVRLRLDLAETGHWRKVETSDDSDLYETTLPLPPPGEEWSPFDTSRPPRGFYAGLAIFFPALIVWLFLIWRAWRARTGKTLPDMSDELVSANLLSKSDQSASQS